MKFLLLALSLVITACGQPRGAPIRVIVPKGATFSAATDSLDRAGLISSAAFFKLYARFNGKDRNIKPGTYLIKRGTPWSEIVAALHGGHGLVNTVTIPEGYTLAQIAPALAKALSVPPDSVAAAINDTALLARLQIPAKTPEGYLFPDTYAFPDGTRPRDAVLEMVKRFEREWKPEWTARLDTIRRGVRPWLRKSAARLSPSRCPSASQPDRGSATSSVVNVRFGQWRVCPRPPLHWTACSLAVRLPAL